MSDERWTRQPESLFDFGAYPSDSVFHDRRSGPERREPAPPPPDGRQPERRTRTDRRRRVDPTTFEKQYSPAELEFMNAMQDFKNRSGKAFPSYSEVLKVAEQLGYHRTPSRPEPEPE